MSTNKCGVCNVIGHNVRACVDANATATLHALITDTCLESSLARCNTMSAGHVSFVLCHGFKVPISGGRSKLIAHVNRRFQVSSTGPDNSVPPANPTPANTRLADLYERVRLNMENKASLTSLIADYSNQYHHVIFTEGHQYYQSNVSTYLHYTIGKGEIMRITTRVTQRILNNIMQLRFANYGMNFDPREYLIERVSNSSWMCMQIEEIATQQFVQLRPNAINYIYTMIKLQQCQHEANYLVHCLEREGIIYTPPVQPQPQPPVARIMRELKTVVLCRTAEEKKQQSPQETCGICFDELKSNLVVKTGCRHNFCAGCISEWAKQRGLKSFIQCPCCRAEIDLLTVGNKTVQKRVKSGLVPFK